MGEVLGLAGDCVKTPTTMGSGTERVIASSLLRYGLRSQSEGKYQLDELE